MGQWVEIAKVSEVPAGQVKVVLAKGKRLALAHVGEEFFCIEDLCTHDNGPLGEGTLTADEVECPRHGARFSVKTGEPLTLPAVVGVQTFRVKVTGERVYVETDEGDTIETEKGE